MHNITAAFRLDSAVLSCEPYGHGHINQTFLVTTASGRLYILQRINHHVFANVPALMENIAAVTRHLATKDSDPRHVLTLVETKSNQTFHIDEEKQYWRVYDFVTDSICLEKAESGEDFRQSGVAFGFFQRQLADFPADTLHETIPAFHNTTSRYAQLHAALKADKMGRAKAVAKELDFVFVREDEAGRMVSMSQQGLLPLRVTHNDTKLNNVMLDAQTRKPLCVIDLDTVMPGLAANDFGDSIRFGASTASEDEADLSKVSLSLPLYEMYANGFLSACGKSLTPAEIETLPLGAKLMTLECGVRFLADYLAGDVYFRTSRPEHNLDRCRTQFTLVADMERKWDEMRGIVQEAARAV